MLLTLADGAVDTAHASMSSAISLLVALLAFILAILALLARRRRGNPGLLWVALAFILFGVKNVFSGVMVTTHIVQHDDIELILSFGDLLILGLLFMPLFMRRRG